MVVKRKVKSKPLLEDFYNISVTKLSYHSEMNVCSITKPACHYAVRMSVRIVSDEIQQKPQNLTCFLTSPLIYRFNWVLQIMFGP